MKSRSRAEATKNLKSTMKPLQNRPPAEADDFVSVARRLGADESKERFEEKLGKIAKAKPREAR